MQYAGKSKILRGWPRRNLAQSSSNDQCTPPNFFLSSLFPRRFFQRFRKECQSFRCSSFQEQFQWLDWL